MNPALLRSQFADLEEPQPAEACFGPANWYATVTPLAEVTDVEDEVNFSDPHDRWARILIRRRIDIFTGLL
jgi:hypothetical protein